MKKQGIITLVLAVMVICLLGSCASAPPRQSFGADVSASRGESEITVNGVENIGTVDVYVDGVLKQTMATRDSVKFVLTDGQHTIHVDWHGMNGLGMPILFKGNPLTINTNAQQYIFSFKLPATIIGKVNLQQMSVSALSGGTSRQVTSRATGLEGATFRTSETLVNELPRNAVIAILSVSARDLNDASYVVDELEFRFVDSRKFKVVDRKTLDSIRSEQKFQLSGDVDDNSAVDIGRMLGASIVVTGTISGTGDSQRLTLKVLDVKTAQIITMARESF